MSGVGSQRQRNRWVENTDPFTFFASLYVVPAGERCCGCGAFVDRAVQQEVLRCLGERIVMP